MNGLDFLDKINDIDDDLLVLEKPAAKVTSLRRRTTIISLCAAAGVFLIIGSVLLIPRFLNKDSNNGISSVRTGSDSARDMEEKDVYEETTAAPEIDDSDDNDIASEETEETSENANSSKSYSSSDYDDEDSSAASGDSDIDNAGEYDGGNQGGTMQGTLKIEDAKIINGDNSLSEDEAENYFDDNGFQAISYILPSRMGLDELDTSASLYGFSYLDITSDPEIDVSTKYYLIFNGDDVFAITSLTKVSDGLRQNSTSFPEWIDELDAFLKEHTGEDVAFVRFKSRIYCIAPDNSCFASYGDASILGTGNLYDIYAYGENIYHVEK